MGVLLPVFSLPSPYGIGTFGKEAFRFVDFLAAGKQAYWQMLPLNPTSYGDSPYQSFSAFALNPYFIDLDKLEEEGLLTALDLEPVTVPFKDRIDYGWVYFNRYPVLRKAFSRFVEGGLDRSPALLKFVEEESYWLEGYAAFMVLKDYFKGKSFQEWPTLAKDSKSPWVKNFIDSNQEALDFYRFLQFEAYRQYGELKAYAHSKGVRIIGDIPIYAALDSADVWSNPDQFQLSIDKKPVWVAGVPPDYFSATGQLWGNPIYDYKRMEKDGFRWWKDRVRNASNIYDVLRIDHFRGMADYWAIPFPSKDATPGHWEIGPGTKLVDAIKEAAKDMQIVAEDLGALDDSVYRLKAYSQWPGMHIFEFGFDSKDPSNHDLPANYEPNSVAYIGTHDNQTLKGFIANHPNLYPFMGQVLGTSNPNSFYETMIWQLAESKADLVIYQMADVLGYDDYARLNTPATLGGTNWQFRIHQDYDKGGASDKLAQIATKTKRI